MERTCVLIADRLRARLFDVEPIINSDHKYQLEEKVDLVNRYPELTVEARALSQKAENQRKESVATSFERRPPDQDHDGRRFAKEVTLELLAYLKTQRPDHLLLFAPPQFLGALREHKPSLRHEVEDIHDYAQELTHLSIPEIRNYLEQKILI